VIAALKVMRALFGRKVGSPENALATRAEWQGGRPALATFGVLTLVVPETQAPRLMDGR